MAAESASLAAVVSPRTEPLVISSIPSICHFIMQPAVSPYREDEWEARSGGCADPQGGRFTMPFSPTCAMHAACGGHCSLAADGSGTHESVVFSASAEPSAGVEGDTYRGWVWDSVGRRLTVYVAAEEIFSRAGECLFLMSFFVLGRADQSSQTGPCRSSRGFHQRADGAKAVSPAPAALA
jgi:hypothetical protein